MTNPNTIDLSTETMDDLQSKRAIADVIGTPLASYGLIEVGHEVATRIFEHNPLSLTGMTLGTIALATGAMFVSVADGYIREMERRWDKGVR